MNQVSRRNTWKSQVIIHKIFNKTFYKPKKKVLILTTIGAMASRLLLATRRVHTWCKIPICGYLYTLIEPNNTLQKLRLIRCIHYWWNVITNQYNVEFHLHKIKQNNVQNHDSFSSKILLLVGDLAQLLLICHH
jgi:hypothetical protein